MLIYNTEKSILIAFFNTNSFEKLSYFTQTIGIKLTTENSTVTKSNHRKILSVQFNYIPIF